MVGMALSKPYKEVRKKDPWKTLAEILASCVTQLESMPIMGIA